MDRALKPHVRGRLLTQEAVVELNHVLEGPEDAPVLVLSNSRLHARDVGRPGARSPRAFLPLRYDQRGYGDSLVLSGPYKIEDLGRDAGAAGPAGDRKRFVLRPLHRRPAGCGWRSEALGASSVWCRAAPRPGSTLRCTTPAPARSGRGCRFDQADVVLERWFTPEFRAARPETVESAGRCHSSTPAEGYAGCSEALVGTPTCGVG